MTHMPERERQAFREPDERPPRRSRSNSADQLEGPNWYPDLELQEEHEDSYYEDPQAMAEDDPLATHSIRLEPLDRTGRDPKIVPRQTHSRQLQGLSSVALKFYANMASQAYYQAQDAEHAMNTIDARYTYYAKAATATDAQYADLTI